MYELMPLLTSTRPAPEVDRLEDGIAQLGEDDVQNRDGTKQKKGRRDETCIVAEFPYH